MNDPVSDLNQFDLGQLASCGWMQHVVFRQSVDSTQELARRLAIDPEWKTPALVLAERQTAGRGRGPARWWSDSGALTFSVVVDTGPLSLADSDFPRVSIAAALAVCQALSCTTALRDCGIKWPNDIYVGGRKICGLLVDSIHMPRQRALADRLVIGIGINVNNAVGRAPPDVAARGTSLCEQSGRRHDLTGLLLALLDQLDQQLRDLAHRDPDQVVLWQSCSLLNNRQVTIRHGARRASGLCLGIDSGGSLLVRTERGIEPWSAGAVCAVTPPI